MESSSPWRRTWWWMLLLVQILGATLVPCVESQSGVISLGSKLSGDETWLSQNGTFTMGFHAIPANSSNLYVGVWYSGVPITPVWLLNRETPVKPGASLSILKGGNITLVDGDGSQVWTSDTAVFGVTEAIFLENGNLVLRNASGATVFDSFDILANTFLPGMYVSTPPPLNLNSRSHFSHFQIEVSMNTYASMSFDDGNWFRHFEGHFPACHVCDPPPASS